MAKKKMTMKLMKLDEDVKVPSYAKPGDAGLDLEAAMSVIINPGEVRKIQTGIAVAIPEGCVGLVFARSGIATKYGLAPANKVGVIDSGYRGEIIVALQNSGHAPVQIVNGDRIAQLVIVPYVAPDIEVVEELNETDRGTGGFGSTGV